jgi:hypothetical protein
MKRTSRGFAFAFTVILAGGARASRTDSPAAVIAPPPAEPAPIERACAAGDLDACYHLAVAYYRGRGVERSVKRAVLLFTRACLGGRADACADLGALADAGDGVTRNATRAARLFRASCRGGDATGCYNLGVLYANGRGVSRDMLRALRLFRRACAGGERDGCLMAMRARARLAR